MELIADPKVIESTSRSKVFIYGSNLNPNRLLSRVPSWDGKYFHAILPNHELRFNMFAEKCRVGANIVSHQTRNVQGIIVLFDAVELNIIDKYEGHPDLYKRIKVNVRTISDRSLRAYTYVAQLKWITEGLLPTDDYLEHIISGASAYGFPKDYIAAIYKQGKGFNFNN